MRGNQEEGDKVSVETWMMEVGRRIWYLAFESRRMQKRWLSAYALGVSSPQLHPVMIAMLEDDVARLALAGIIAPPYRNGRRRDACANDHVWGDDTIRKDAWSNKCREIPEIR